MKTRPLGNSPLAVTEIGFGCAPIAGLYRACPEDQAQDVLRAAWDAGIRYFDTAPHYGAGLSEERLGRFLAGKPRSDYVISTKVGRLFTPVSREKAPDYGFVDANPAVVTYDYSRDGILRSLEASRKRTGLESFDILFVHDIGPYTHNEPDNSRHLKDFRDSGIRALNDLKAEGAIKAWGLGVNETQVCLDIMKDTHLDVILMAGRYTLLDRAAETELLPLCIKRGTAFVIGGVFNSGILATGAIEGATFDYTEANQDIRTRVTRMQEVARAQGSDLATLALKFPLQTPVVVSVLLGTAKRSSLQRNLAAYRSEISSQSYEQMAPLALSKQIAIG